MRIKFHNLFFIFFIILFEPHDLRIMLKGLTRVYSDCFLCLIFNWFFFQFYYSILDRLGIKFYNLFLFTFYEDILVSWPIKLFFIFFNFNFQYWFDWELDFIIYFDLLSMKLSKSHNSNHKFNMLTQIDQIQSILLLS